TTYTTAAYGSNPNVFIRKLPQTATTPSTYCPSRVSYYASSQLTHLSQVTLHDPRMQDPAGRLRDLATPSRTITPQTLLHEGTFGRVYRGEYKNEENWKPFRSARQNYQASKLQVTLMLAEGTMLHGLSHKNVLPILAVSLDNPKQPLLVYPYANKGNLKRFLQNCHHRGEEQYTLLTQDIVDMAIQVVLAMLFLHSQRICHKDLATRNCVVDEKLRVRVTDNALARDLFPTDYYCLGDNENRPIKWLAIESLLHKQFTGASDVWSFGVLLWELTTLAQQPYVEVDPFEMAAYLRDGYRLAQPINCPDELFALMACCWLNSPEERPTFVQLLACLQEFYTALGRYI
ncbi:hypothetical protein L9F63_001819, partial [Diploptera punctata]